jgi:hypothetical protein
MRKLIMLFAVSLTALVGASAAGANNFPIFKCPYTTTVAGSNGFAGSSINIGGANNSLQQPLILHFGWLAQKSQQITQFLKAQSSRGATITETDLTPNQVVWSQAPWSTGFLDGWGPIIPATGTFNGSTFTGFSTVWRSDTESVPNPIPTLSPGSYSLSFEVDLKTGVNDGVGGAGPGALYKTTNCPFTVQG